MPDEEWDPDDAETVMSVDSALDSLSKRRATTTPTRADTDPVQTSPAPGMDGTILGVGAAPALTARPGPRQVAATDPTPRFRDDLTLTRSAQGFVVRDPKSSKVLALNEFEVSLARMLDGRRTVADVLDQSRGLGIPTNLESLQRFILRLEEHGFLATASAEASGPSTWRARSEWENSVRSLFQSGIRLLRAGKHAEAAGYFEALLAQDPENVEARELLEICNSGEPMPRPERPSIQVPTVPRTTGQISVQRASAQMQAPRADDSVQPQRRSVKITTPPQQQVVWARTQQPNVVRPVHHGSSTLRIVVPIVLAVFLAAGVIVFVILRHGDKTPAQPAPAQVTNTEPPKVDPPKVDPPAPAQTGSATPAQGSATQPAGSAAPPAGSAAPPAGSAADPASLVVVTQVKSPYAGEITHAYLDSARSVTKGEKLFEITRVTTDPEKSRALRTRIAELEKIAAQDNGGSFVPAAVIDATSELARKRKELARLAKVEKLVVEATQAGHAEPRVQRGLTIKVGTVLAEITPEQR